MDVALDPEHSQAHGGRARHPGRWVRAARICLAIALVTTLSLTALATVLGTADQGYAAILVALLDSKKHLDGWLMLTAAWLIGASAAIAWAMAAADRRPWVDPRVCGACPIMTAAGAQLDREYDEIRGLLRTLESAVATDPGCNVDGIVADIRARVGAVEKRV